MTNPIITAYLAANAKYIDGNSAAALSRLPDSAWPAVLEAVEVFAGGDEPGIDCNVATTTETLDDFEAARMARWSDRGFRKVLDCAGHSAVHYDSFQLFRRQPRRSQVVLDLGDIRVSIY